MNAEVPFGAAPHRRPDVIMCADMCAPSLDGVDIRFGHSVMQFGAALARASGSLRQ